MTAAFDRLSGHLDRRHARRHVSALDVEQRPDPDRPPGTDLLPGVKHIVVLMMENHSYDSYLGMLDHADGLPRDASGQPTPVNSGVRSHHLGSTTQFPGVPVQSWAGSHEQYDDGRCDGFVRSVELTAPQLADQAGLAMGYWDERDLPFYYGLARTFTVADRWFGSCLGPTFPNRRFLIAGTANGLIDDHPVHLFDSPDTGTVFDLLTHHGITWRNYHPGSSLAAGAKRLAGATGVRLGRRMGALVARWFPPVLDLLAGRVQFTADVYPLGLGGALTHLRGLDDFFHDAAAGTLPAFSIVDPDYKRYSEENPQDIQLGESFAADVVHAVTHGLAWRDTLLFWVYDEHGGYYDHVPPPPAPPPDDVAPSSRLPLPHWLLRWWRRTSPRTAHAVVSGDGTDGAYDRLGFRVPAVVVSPYARPGGVDSTVYDHTSILRLLELKWNLPPLTRRDAAATAPLAAVDLDTEPALLDPPTLPEPALGRGAWRRQDR